MSFVLSKVLWLVVAPGNLLVLLAALGVALQGLAGPRGRRLGRALGALVAAVMVLLLVVPVDIWLMRALEGRFPAAALPARVDGVIVLGGMMDPSSAAAWGRPRLNQEADRLTELLILARRYPEARLVFSGGSGALADDSLAEAPQARLLLEQLGAPLARLEFEGTSRNTWENVVNSQALVQPRPGETWVLITSALNMPRAVGIFRQRGWPVVPDPVAFRTGLDAGTPPSLTFAATLERLEFALHEWTGLLAYHALGRTDAWFPGP